jgi:hypothetical protein
MRVVHTTDLSDYGNDCYIYKSVSLLEAFGMYNIIIAEKVTGWVDVKRIYTQSEITCDEDRAWFLYKKYGGIVEDNRYENN